MATYAADTSVSSSSSRAEIERDLERFGASAFSYGWDREHGRAVIEFTVKGRHVRYAMAMPPRNHPDVLYTPSRRRARTAEGREQAYEQLVRSRWRALALGVRAILAMVEADIVTLEDAFLAQTVFPGGETVGEWVTPVIEAAYRLDEGPSPFPVPAIEAAP